MTDTIEKARSKLKEIIIEELSKLNWPELPINSDPPEGDLSVICFPAAKEMKKAAEEIATELAEHLLKETSIKEIEIQDEKEAMSKYGSKDSGASLGDILGSVLKKKEWC